MEVIYVDMKKKKIIKLCGDKGTYQGNVYFWYIML